MFSAMDDKKTVFVGLSGGVDSSVAALRLKRAGFDVVGVFIKTWHPDFIECNEEEERLDAMRVAAHLKIPFLTLDAEEEYKKDVADYMIAEYKAGRTPNPDVMCNKYVKFGAFLKFAMENGADAVATGHYAQVENENGRFKLLRGQDASKDQSYFLWTLTQEQLSRILFPVGDTTKEQIRKEAHEAGLPTAKKPDSQGICFLGEVDMKDFLSHYITVEKGNVLDAEGNVIGEHDGALYYTLGERHGFTVWNVSAKQSPQYVIAKDTDANTITVAPEPLKIENHGIELHALNEIEPLESETECEAQFRYRQKPFKVQLKKLGAGRASLVVNGSVEMPSIGQSCVLYQGDECLGGGIIV
jgi:tRNA-uridine 2-sulfurtransferase